MTRVKRHWRNGYTREDGTYVQGHWVSEHERQTPVRGLTTSIPDKSPGKGQWIKADETDNLIVFKKTDKLVDGGYIMDEIISMIDTGEHITKDKIINNKIILRKEEPNPETYSNLKPKSTRLKKLENELLTKQRELKRLKSKYEIQPPMEKKYLQKEIRSAEAKIDYLKQEIDKLNRRY